LIVEIIEVYPGQENELYTCISAGIRPPWHTVMRVEQRIWHMIDLPWRLRLDLCAELREMAMDLPPMKIPPMRMVSPVKFSWKGIPGKL